MGVAIAYGLNLGATASPLLAQRWEEGWQTPLLAWREQLGIRPLLQTNPFPLLPGEAPRTRATVRRAAAAPGLRRRRCQLGR